MIALRVAFDRGFLTRARVDRRMLEPAHEGPCDGAGAERDVKERPAPSYDPASVNDARNRSSSSVLTFEESGWTAMT